MYALDACNVIRTNIAVFYSIFMLSLDKWRSHEKGWRDDFEY